MGNEHLVERERLTEVKGTLLVVVRFEETSRENVGSTNFESMMGSSGKRSVACVVCVLYVCVCVFVCVREKS